MLKETQKDATFPVLHDAADLPGAGWMRWLLFLTVSGYLLFAHGCHADKDTELFSRFAIWASGKHM